MELYSDKIIEQISISKLNMAIIKTGKNKIEPDFQQNDKGLSWDGYLILHEKEGSISKDDVISRIPIQIKGHGVKTLPPNHHAQKVEISHIRNYFYDGGVIFFVVDINNRNCEDVRIFYKKLLPVDLKQILDTANKNKTKTIHINNILKDDTDFFKECIKFDIESKHQSVKQVENALSLDDIKDKQVEFVSIDNPLDVLKDDVVYPYVRDEYNMLIPLKSGLRVDKILFTNRKKISFKDKHYEGNIQTIIEKDGTESIVFGDKITITKDKINWSQSEKSILERYATLNFLIDFIKEEHVTVKEIEERLSDITHEIQFIEKVIRVCKKYNINKEKILLKNFTKYDFGVVEALDNDKILESYELSKENINNIELKIMNFQENDILLLRIEVRDGTVLYIDFYSDKLKLSLGTDKGDLDISKFLLLDRRSLLCVNFDYDKVFKSIVNIDVANMSENLVAAYSKFELELIAAWDKKHNNDYLKIANKINEILKKFDTSEVYDINRIQIDYRLKNQLSNSDKDILYKIKLTSEDLFFKIGAAILVEDIETFSIYFNQLTDTQQETFKSFPLYNIYEKQISR